MTIVKLCLAYLQCKLSRKEMKSVLAGRMPVLGASATVTCMNGSSKTMSCSGNCRCSGSDADGHSYAVLACFDSEGGLIGSAALC